MQKSYDDKTLYFLRLYNKAIDISEEYWGRRSRMAKARLDIVDRRKVEGVRYLMKRYPDKIIREGLLKMVNNAFCNGRTKERTRPVQLVWIIDPNHPERFCDLLEGTL